MVTARGDRDVTVVHAEDPALVLLDTSLAQAAVAPSSLVATKSDTGNVCIVVHTGELGEGTPSAPNVQHTLSGLKVNLLADDGELVVLELLEGLLLVDIRNDTGGVDHTWAQEPAVEVIASVVVVTDLLLI